MRKCVCVTAANAVNVQVMRDVVYGVWKMKWLILLLAAVPGCEFTFTFRFGEKPKPDPVVQRPMRQVDDPTGHSEVDRMGGWEAIEKKRRTIPRAEYDAWLKEHRRSQDLGPIGWGG